MYVGVQLATRLQSASLLSPLLSPSTKASHSGSNLGSNLTHPKTILLMWQVFNEERGACGNIICYYNIALPEAK